MSCKESQDKILIFDQLSEHDQDHLLEHIDLCSECHSFFDKYLTLEEGLDLLLQDIELHPSSIKKKAVHRIIQRALLTCASIFLLIVGAWNTPPVKAAIEKALNEVIVDYLQKGKQPLLPDNEKSSTEKIIYTEQFFSNGTTIYRYASGQSVRTEFDNGDYTISDSNYLATYSKKDNLFYIQELTKGDDLFIRSFKDMDPNKITFKGDKKYLDRVAEVYAVDVTKELVREYWFDKQTHLYIKEVDIFKGKRIDNDSIKLLKIIEVKKNHRLFDFIAPDKAKIIDESSQVDVPRSR